MTWLPGTTAGADDFAATFGLRPNLFEAWRGFEALLWQDGRVDPVVLELCRRRLASLQCSKVESPGTPGPAIDPRKLEHLDIWWHSDRFSWLERDCLRFAEQFSYDPNGIDDVVARRVTEALGDAGTVAFVEALAIFDGITRFCAMLDVDGAGA